MSRSFERLAVVGLGLLGGSIALAARRRGLAGNVVGVARRRETREAAVHGGIVDEVHAEPGPAFEGADLVVLATPIAAMEEVLRAGAAALSPAALVTDVGSVKSFPAERLPGLLPPGVSYLGSHPMAGSHLRGVQHAREDLLEGSPCVVCPTPDSSAESVERLAAFWMDLGARVFQRDPARHDLEVAAVSHAPHVLAFTFARSLSSLPPGAEELRGTGFRDFVRIARSDSELWADILMTNRKALAGPLHAASERLAELTRLLEAGDLEAVERFLADAGDALAQIEDLPDPEA